MDFYRYTKKYFRCRGLNFSLPRLAKTDRIGLAKMYHDLGFNKGVEIGVREGKHAKILCDNNPNINLTCIDPWQPYSRWTKELMDKFYSRTLRRTRNSNVKLLKKTSMEALKDFEDGSLDFAYIDGNHSFDYVMMDIIEWSKKVRKGGVIGCHDYFHCSDCGVVEAVNAYTQFHRIAPWFVTYELLPTAFWVNK